jgi:NitT/TauT family transport system permease protein
MRQNALPDTLNEWFERCTAASRSSLRRFVPLIALAAFVLLWQIVALLEIYPSFIIPAPGAVVTKFVDVASDGTLWLHTRVTLWEIAAGLAVGVSIGVTLGYVIARSRLLEDVLSPLVVTLQSTPVVAYAPLLVIWFGSGPSSKIITCALIVFFPVLMSTIVGIRNTPPSLRDLMRSLGATRWQLFTKLEVPAAMPVFLGGLKVSATLAVIGAVVGEFVGASAGLGFLVNVARNQYDTPLVLVAVLTLAVIARVMYGAVSLMERRALAWQGRVRKEK